MGDQARHVTDIIEEEALKMLHSAAEAAFHKDDGRLMKFVQVRVCTSAVMFDGWVMNTRGDGTEYITIATLTYP
jgi:hypothetical protein